MKKTSSARRVVNGGARRDTREILKSSTKVNLFIALSAALHKPILTQMRERKAGRTDERTDTRSNGVASSLRRD